jgi:hypothetical protein
MKLLNCIASLLVLAGMAYGQESYRWEKGGVRTSGTDDQIEVGGPLAGLEFHGSRPLPSRISFYAPVANSLDLSTDYWKRGDTRVVKLALACDKVPLHLDGTEPWEYRVMPDRVDFFAREGDLRFTVTYRCGVNEAPVAMSIEITNEGRAHRDIEVNTTVALTLRSCQSYDRINPSRLYSDGSHGLALAEYDDARLARASLYVLRVESEATPGREGKQSAARTLLSQRESCAFRDVASLDPGKSCTFTRILGTSARKGVTRSLRQLPHIWKKDLQDYDARVRTARYGGTPFSSGDAWTDSAVSYAKAILAANEHYLNGAVVPMPCPAEYNFFFTHDVLLTDLSAILFDPGRVKRDLLYLLKLSKNQDLPHAYYWKDDGFKTEFCDAGNWNNLWIVLASAAYYRHTFDEGTVRRLHPLITRALEKTLTKRKGDVLEGVEPDWWDFGSAPGARAYLTILTVRAIEEYVYLSSCLHQNPDRLAAYEKTAAELRGGLLENLWDESKSYLFNTTPGGVDGHVYMGPLLAAVYGVIPAEMGSRLVGTATKLLLDPAVGLRTVSPADFHADSVRTFFGVKSNEAGGQYRYANGGIWYLGNAWYAWSLHAIGDVEGAYTFFKRTMTVDGVQQSPYGQPALYEYRYADTSASDHGRVDKPTMMWSAGFCAGTAYRLSGFKDNVWNVSVADVAPTALEHVRAAYTFGGSMGIERSGKGPMLTRLRVDGREYPSRILPLSAASGKSIDVEMGPIRHPFLDSANAVLHDVRFDSGKGSMHIALSSFRGHETVVKIITPRLAQSVSVNASPWRGWSVSSNPLGTIIITVRYEASAGVDSLEIKF